MRLLPGEKGGLRVLCRADAHARDEAPLGTVRLCTVHCSLIDDVFSKFLIEILDLYN